MPIYEYRCDDCGEKFEKWLRSMSVREEICCPRCGSLHTRKAISLFSSSRSTGGARLADSSCAPTGG